MTGAAHEVPVGGHGSEAPEPAQLACLRRHGDHSSAFLTLSRAMLHYTLPEIDGFIAYQPVGGRHVAQLCGPVAAPHDQARLLDAFLDWAAGQRRRVTAVQLTHADAQRFAARGFTVNQLGSSYSIDLDRFSLRGTQFMRVRNKLQRARRCGVSVRELSWDEQCTSGGAACLADIDRSWLAGKGARAKELQLMVGERGGPAGRFRRLFVASVGADPIAYATYSPCFGSRPGWLYDLTRRKRDAPPGTIELLFMSGIERLVDEGCRWLHLGLTPIARIDRRYELPHSSSAMGGWFLRLLARHGEALYPARSQERFKLKWAPHAIEPEYIGFAPRISAGAVWSLLRATRAI